jgi:peptide/nickel transport system ATP-binding protein
MNLLDVMNAVKAYPVRSGQFWEQLLDRNYTFEFMIPEANRRYFYAVNDITLSLRAGECLGVVGESGSGKTTLIRMIAGLIEPTDGQIRLKGHELTLRAEKKYQHRIQMVFQDPTESLNPAFTVRRIIADPLICLLKIRDGQAINARVEALAELVYLPKELLDRYPHQLSGGQKARVGIARALAAEPEVILLDEPTTALDVSVQARILLLLSELRAKLGLSYLFVSHDLSVVRLLCDRLIIMQHGRIVESGTVQDVFNKPRENYTKTLLESIPSFDTT